MAQKLAVTSCTVSALQQMMAGEVAAGEVAEVGVMEVIAASMEILAQVTAGTVAISKPCLRI